MLLSPYRLSLHKPCLQAHTGEQLCCQPRIAICQCFFLVQTTPAPTHQQRADYQMRTYRKRQATRCWACRHACLPTTHHQLVTANPTSHPFAVEAMYLHVPACKQLLHQRPVHPAHAGVVHGKAMRQHGLQLGVRAHICLSLQAGTECS